MKKILIISRSFYPAKLFGGPTTSLTNLVDLLSDSFKVNIFTSAFDAGKIMKNIEYDRWYIQPKFGADVFYESNIFSGTSALKNELLKDYDFIYINSFFDFFYSIRPLMLLNKNKVKSKLIIAPRGELSMGAMSIKPFKKNLFIKLLQLLGVKLDMAQATSELEKEEIKKLGLFKNVIISPNISSVKKFNRHKNLQKKSTFLYLGRITEKKGLLIFCKALKEIKHDLMFKIVGNIDDELYWQKCLKILNNLPKNISFSYQEGVRQDQTNKFYQESDFFVLPTLNENYGHTIVEACLNKCCPIISKNTPWSDIKDLGGFIVRNQSAKDYEKIILNALNLSNNEYLKITNSISQYFENKIYLHKKIAINLFKDN